jgi:1,4-dihydroxy-2-naphthoate octaprenyltransferase
MASALISLLITAIILAIIVGIAWAVWKLIAGYVPAPFGQIITIIFMGVVAIVVVLYILIPLIRMIPAAAGAG